jgi:hypothetical protein
VHGSLEFLDPCPSGRDSAWGERPGRQQCQRVADVGVEPGALPEHVVTALDGQTDSVTQVRLGRHAVLKVRLAERDVPRLVRATRLVTASGA